MNLWKALPDAAQHLFVPIDLQIRMQSALHQYAGTAKFHGLTNFVVNGFELEYVALFGLRSLQRTIKSTERAIFCAEIGVIDVPIDDVGDHALRMELATDGV